MECHLCGERIESVSLVDRFCSVKCCEDYWDNPIKVTVISDCPTCKKEYRREKYPVLVTNGCVLEQCDSCQSDEIIYF